MITLPKIFENIFHLVYPNVCAGCGSQLKSGENTICVLCDNSIAISPFHTIENNSIDLKLLGRVAVERATSMCLFAEQSIVQQLIHQLKYKGNYDVGVYFGKKYGACLKQEYHYAHIDAIIPVPLHPKKMITRGYNQSEKFADGLSQSLDVPVLTDVLHRKSNKISQTKLNRISRWNNVNNDFYVNNIEKITNKKILLVDDVLTTGATLDACASALHSASPVSISIATIAVVL